MKNIKRIWFLLVLVVLAGSCDSIKKKEAISTSLLTAPQSYASIPVILPVSDLEYGINKILPEVLVNDALGIGKDKKDTLILKIQRRRKVNLAYRNSLLYVSVPVKVSAIIKKKVMGKWISNTNQPVTFEAVVQLKTEPTLTQDWDMDFPCQWNGILWEKPPIFKLLGLELDLSSTIEKIVNENASGIEKTISSALNNKIEFHKILNEVLSKLGDDKLIGENTINLFLALKPTAVRGTLLTQFKDTIGIHLESELFVSLRSEPSKKEKFTLEKRKKPMNAGTQFSLFADCQLSSEYLTSLAKRKLLNKSFAYAGYEFISKEVTIAIKNSKLQVNLNIEGTISGKITIKGLPELSNQGVLSISDFTYEISSADQWIQLTDKAVHGSLESYLADLVSLDLSNWFDSLDDKIKEGLQKSKSAEKMDLHIEIVKIDLYNKSLPDNILQLIFHVEGNAQLLLKKGIL